MGYISFSRNPCEDYTQLLRFPIILIMKNHHDKSDPLLILLADIGLSQIHGIDAQTIQYFYLLNSLSSSLCKWTDLKNIIPPLHILVSNTFEWSLGKKCANISFLLPMSVLDPNAAYQSGIKHISYSSVTDFVFFFVEVCIIIIENMPVAHLISYCIFTHACSLTVLTDMRSVRRQSWSHT